MAHFAKVENDLVTDVIVIDNEHENEGMNYINEVLGLPGEWVQTSYNGNIRKNFAGIGFTYDRTNDVFISQPPNVELPDGVVFVLDNDFQWITKEISA